MKLSKLEVQSFVANIAIMELKGGFQGKNSFNKRGCIFDTDTCFANAGTNHTVHTASVSKTD